MLPRPKSTILTLDWASRSRFSGFRSRWMTLELWQYSMPLMIWWKKTAAASSSTRLCLTMKSNSSPPDAYSMIRNTKRFVSMTSYRLMMFGCFRCFRMCISRDTRSTSSTSTILLFSRILMATLTRVRRCTPFFTLPNVPSPIVFPIRRDDGGGSCIVLVDGVSI